MISLKEKRVALVNLPVTIKALEDVETLITYYSADKHGSATCLFTHVDGPGQVSVHFDRDIVVSALETKRQRLVEYLATLGIEA